MRKICIRPRFWLVLMVAMALGFGAGSALPLLRGGQLCARAGNLQAQLAALEEQAAGLRAQLEYAQSDAYVQRAAREELNLIFPGEVRYIPERKTN